MLAEMWIDPDSEGSGASESDSERTVRGLIKFDINEVGFFDLFFLYSSGKIRMQLNYPDELKENSGQIEGEIKEILARNGIKAEELYFGTSGKSIPIEEAFPKIFERKNSINVKI